MPSMFSKEYVDIVRLVANALTQSFRCWPLKKSHPQSTELVVRLTSHHLLTRVPAPNPCRLIAMQMLHLLL